MYIENCLQILYQSPFFVKIKRAVLKKNNGHQILISKGKLQNNQQINNTF